VGEFETAEAFNDLIVAYRDGTPIRLSRLGYAEAGRTEERPAGRFTNRDGVERTAALGVTLLLWHEFTVLAGRPVGVALALFSAAVWALGTHMMRRSRIEADTLTLSFWMTALAAVVATALALLFEREQWQLPPGAAWGAIAYNAVLIFGFSQAAWLSLARGLPPIASTLSVMFIPVLGVLVGAAWLGEVLHWQDAAAVVLMVGAIASVLWPARARAPTAA
jgi:drug/metabolite transporter (DMT)-like permease